MENFEKYIKLTRIDKNGEEITKRRSHILQVTDSAIFMASSLSNLVHNHSEGIHRIKCKYGPDEKKFETCGIRYKYCNCFLEYTNSKKNYLIEYKCLCYNKNYQHKFDEKLKEQFLNTYKYSNHDNNKFILLLQKCVDPYEYMDDWEKLNIIT